MKGAFMVTEKNHVMEDNDAAKEKLLLEQYERYLCGFCRECAYMEDMKIRVEKGEPVTRVELVSHFYTLRNCKEALLETKRDLGMGGGISFTENTDFQGFSYRNGLLIGDCTHLYRIIKPWLENFNPKEPAKYEVGMLLLFHYSFREERRRKEWKEERRKLFFDKLLRIIFPRYWIRRMERKKNEK